jgi:hypothetical protein
MMTDDYHSLRSWALKMCLVIVLAWSIKLFSSLAGPAGPTFRRRLVARCTSKLSL